MRFTLDMTLKDIMAANPKTVDAMQEMGLHCLGCPFSIKENLGNAAQMHGIDPQALLARVNEVEQGEMSAQAKANAQPEASVLQMDKKTYAIAPHIPAGVATPDILRKIADVAEKYQAAALKVTTAQRIAIVGLKPEDVPKAWADLGMDPGHAAGVCVRSVKVCPGNTFCKRGLQETLTFGMELDRRYHGMPLPSKFKIAVAGCPNKCTDSATVDLGLMGTSKGYHLYVGGNGGVKPRLADLLWENLRENERFPAVEAVMEYYKERAKPQERLGRLLDRLGLDELRQRVSRALAK
ncbi:nitrite reductase [NAD(P)H] [Peptococcaceae bacterium CEB3]|nr:nitrite reductase [NAD(P)H] [Peptococcaceae bacterium CEB3]